MKQRIESERLPALRRRRLRRPIAASPTAASATSTPRPRSSASTRRRCASGFADGETLADVAKEKGKSVDGLVAAIVAATTKRLDEAVAAGRITKAQRDEIVAGLKERTTAIVNGAFPALKGRGGPGFGRDFGPPASARASAAPPRARRRTTPR